MSSFTSSSKLSSIAVPLIVCLASLGAYEMGLRSRKVPLGEGVGPQQSNICRVENYLYRRNENPEAVAVGSSLMANLKGTLGPRVVNLGLAGGCSVTGLDIVNRGGSKPG